MIRSGDRGWNPEVSVIGPGGCMRIHGFSLRSGDRIGALVYLDPEVVVGTRRSFRDRFGSGDRLVGTRRFFEVVMTPMRPRLHRGTVLRLPRQDYYWKSLTCLVGAGVGVMTQVPGLCCFPPRSVLIQVLFTLVLWGPRCALGCTGVLGSFDSKLRLAHTHSCFMSHTRFDSLWACHCGHATFCKGWPGSEVSGDLIQLRRQFEIFSQPLSFYTINPNVIQENEFLQFLNHKVPMVTPIKMKQEQLGHPSSWTDSARRMAELVACSIQLGHPPNWTGSAWTGSAQRMAELVTSSIQLGHPPNWTGPARWMAELVTCSIQLGHPPSWTSSAQRMAELVTSSIQLGHPPNWTGPARWMAELVTCSIQLGHPPSWTSSAQRMAELVAWSNQLGHPPSWTGSARRMAEMVVLVDPARRGELGSVLCPPFNKTGITYATGC
ncbi:hypothetical protein F2Q69_00035201 [Brassica cretica]|uniref:Uncharacterized protein n=1 Tax=Brassica cretica TaxID=69181 RepID=A0A8S9SVJ5_BRACR|nr:hypothetical protein F2Q69_00035201 [Brassica cretica]